jgi:hypothetical protein
MRMTITLSGAWLHFPTRTSLYTHHGLCDLKRFRPGFEALLEFQHESVWEQWSSPGVPMYCHGFGRTLAHTADPSGAALLSERGWRPSLALMHEVALMQTRRIKQWRAIAFYNALAMLRFRQCSQQMTAKMAKHVMSFITNNCHSVYNQKLSLLL